VKKKLIRLAVITGIILLVFVVYVEVVNRNSKNMTYRQKVLKAVYPAWMWWTKLWGRNTSHLAQEKQPVLSFYDLSAALSGGDTLSFSSLQGRKILIVNTASDCGYTGQYADLQALYEKEAGGLEIIAFPANDFRQQEKGTDEEIAAFCKSNFGVSFPLVKKSTVVSGSEQHPVYQWLTDSAKNGWNTQAPEWNFSKYLINEQGMLTHYFGPSISPLDEKLTAAIHQ
jgi:glutathione peroxidase